MKHGTECVNLWTDELVALAQIAGVVIPQSLTDLIAHWPPNPPGVANAQTRALAKIALAVRQRSDTRTDYAWPFPKTPPTWQQAPMQVSPQQAMGMSSELPGEVLPPAPWSMAPNLEPDQSPDQSGGGGGGEADGS
jgi:hypothetical protein